MNVGRDKDTSKAKTLQPTIIYYLQHLHSFTYRRRHQRSFKRKERKDPLTDKGVRRGPWAFITWGLGDRKDPTRPLQVTCTLEVPRWTSRDVCPHGS